MWPDYSADITDRLQECFAHGDLGSVNGHPAIDAFERAFARRLGESRRTAFFNSGTSAYCAGLFGLALPMGSEVVVPRQTFRASATPLLQFGLVPAFAECAPESGLVSADSVEAALSSRTSAIVVTHQWGSPVPIESIAKLAHSRSLRLIEDCSHAHGGRYNSRALGTFGDIAFFSCGTTKPVSGGTGGILATALDDVYQRALLYGQPKRRCEHEVIAALQHAARVGLGVNLRGNPFSATLALDHLSRLPALLAVRAENLRCFDLLVVEHLPQLEPVVEPKSWTNGTWYKRPYVVQSGDPATFVRCAQQVGLEFGLQDNGLDVELPHAQAMLTGKQPVVRGLPLPERRIVTFAGLGLYAPNWHASLVVDQLRAMSSACSSARAD